MKAKTAVSKRPKLLPVSEEMKQWSAMLEQEMGAWPKVDSRPMFGMIAFYRRGAIFAALPRTRALSNPRSILFRFDPMSPELTERTKKQANLRRESAFAKGHWLSLELETVESLRDALWWLNRAYECASAPATPERRRRLRRHG